MRTLFKIDMPNDRVMVFELVFVDNDHGNGKHNHMDLCAHFSIGSANAEFEDIVHYPIPYSQFKYYRRWNFIGDPSKSECFFF